jgi:bifunctional DNase/RNase
MLETVVESVRASFTTQERIVVLKEVNSERCLFIHIGTHEAFYIAMELQKVVPERPLTPDLLKSVICELGAKVTQVVVTDLNRETFFARIIMDLNGRHVEVDSRPSDAIALAIRVKAPIYVEESVMARAGIIPEVEKKADVEPERRSGGLTTMDVAKLGPFKDFISSLDDLDDLGKPEGKK